VTDEQADYEASEAGGVARESAGEGVGARRANTGTDQGCSCGEPACGGLAQWHELTPAHDVSPKPLRFCGEQPGES